MSTYLEKFELVSDTQFAKRLQMAWWIAAVTTLANGASTNAAKLFSRNQLKGAADTDLFRRMAIRCAASGIEKTATDAEVQTAVDTVFAELAS